MKFNKQNPSTEIRSFNFHANARTMNIEHAIYGEIQTQIRMRIVKNTRHPLLKRAYILLYYIRLHLMVINP